MGAGVTEMTVEIPGCYALHRDRCIAVALYTWPLKLPCSVNPPAWAVDEVTGFETLQSPGAWGSCTPSVLQDLAKCLGFRFRVEG